MKLKRRRETYLKKLKQPWKALRRQISVEQAMKALEKLPYEDIDLARQTTTECLRRGILKSYFVKEKQ